MPIPKPTQKNTRASPLPQSVGEDPISKDLTKYADQYVTTRQAAEMLGVVTEHVNRLLIDRKIKGAKLGHSWLVFKPSIAKYLKTKSRAGRPTSAIPTLKVEE